MFHLSSRSYRILTALCERSDVMFEFRFSARRTTHCAFFRIMAESACNILDSNMIAVVLTPLLFLWSVKAFVSLASSNRLPPLMYKTIKIRVKNCHLGFSTRPFHIFTPKFVSSFRIQSEKLLYASPIQVGCVHSHQHGLHLVFYTTHNHP